MKILNSVYGQAVVTIALISLLALLLGCDREKTRTPAPDTHAGESHDAHRQAQSSEPDGHEEHEGHEEDEGHEDHRGTEQEAAHQDEAEPDHEEHAEGEPGREGQDQEARIVSLPPEQREEFGITVQQAAPGELQQYVELPGEIVLNADRVAHVVPRVPGIVRQVKADLGDQVDEGEPLGVLESRELADAKAVYLAARERLALARANFEREEKLYRKKISAEQDYLDARQALAEARIELRSAEQKLHALGFSKAYLEELPNQPDASFTRYRVTAPIDGTVIEKHISLGENIQEHAEVFTVADLSTVWVDIDVYQKDLGKIRKGQRVVIDPGHEIAKVTGEISWVGPLVGEETRTAMARVVLPNPEGVLRPGLFITARIAVKRIQAKVVVPETALQTIEGEPAIFVQTEEGFAVRKVRLGARSEGRVAVLAGLRPGERYAATNTFTLKAELNRSALEHAGHAH